MEPTKYPEQAPEDKAYLRTQLIKFFLFLGVTIGITIWMMIDNIWPASKLIDLQLRWFDGEYYPKYTAAVVWILLILAIVAVMGVIGWIWGLLKGKK